MPAAITILFGNDSTVVQAGFVALVSLNRIQGSDFLLAGRTNIPISMFGGDAADLMIGSMANDFIRGGRGGDALAGGAGADVFDYGYAERVNAD